MVVVKMTGLGTARRERCGHIFDCFSMSDDVKEL